MSVKKIATGQMWKDEQSGEIYVVTTFYKDVLASFAVLRAADQNLPTQSKKAKIVKTEAGETLAGFREADLV